MTVLVDTGVFYAHHDGDAARHDAASNAMDVVLGGRFGQPIATDYIYDEALTLMLSRSGDVSATTRLGRRIRGVGEFPDAFELRFLGERGFRRGVEAFERYDDHGLSFTDATIVAYVEAESIDNVLSFDDGLDGLVDRLDPAAF